LIEKESVGKERISKCEEKMHKGTRNKSQDKFEKNNSVDF
jgi:hypothetical protein